MKEHQIRQQERKDVQGQSNNSLCLLQQHMMIYVCVILSAVNRVTSQSDQICLYGKSRLLPYFSSSLVNMTNYVCLLNYINRYCIV